MLNTSDPTLDKMVIDDSVNWRDFHKNNTADLKFLNSIASDIVLNVLTTNIRPVSII